MKLTGTEARELAEKIRASCGAMKELRDDQLATLINIAVRDATTINKQIEDAIAEAAGIPGPVAGSLLVYGALATIYESLPEGDDRRAVLAAGREIGELVAKKYGEKIQEKLVDDQPKN